MRFIVFGAWTIIACAETGCVSAPSSPLVFVSSNIVGIDITAASSTSATPGLTVGYKSFDGAIVPTQRAQKNAIPVTGCYASAQSGTIQAPCASETELSAATQSTTPPPSEQKSPPKAVAPAPTSSSGEVELDNKPMTAPPVEARVRSGSVHFEHAVFVPKVTTTQPSAEQPSQTTNPDGSSGSGQGGASEATGTTPQTAGGTGAAGGSTTSTTQPGAKGAQAGVQTVASHQNIRDALSVFSSFSAKTSAETGNASINLGKLFATGVSAQILTEGVNYHLQYSGVVSCVQAVTAAKKANVSDEKLPTCQ